MFHRGLPLARSIVRSVLLGSALTTSLAVGSAGNAPRPFHPPIGDVGDIRSIDLAADGKVLHAVFAARVGNDPKPAAFHALSRNAGKNWTRPVPISKPGDSPVLSKRGNDVQLAVRGRDLVATWQQQGELPGTGPLAIAWSQDGGQRWSRGENPVHGDSTNNQSYPDLTVDPYGRFHLVWLDDREENGNTQGLRHALSADRGRRWQSETTIDLDVCTCCWNRAVSLPDRSIAVLYRGNHPRDMRVATREPKRGTWMVRGTVGSFDWQFEGCPHCGGGLVALGTPNGPALHSVVWTGKPGSAGLYYLGSANAGAAWSSPLAVADAPSREADIAATSRAVMVVYTSPGANGATPIVARRSNDHGGHWGEPVTVSGPEAAADHPRVIAVAGGFLAYWTEPRTGGGKTLALNFLE